jgi:hypothetical protein
MLLVFFLFIQDTLIRWEPEVNLSQDTVYNFYPWIECKDNYVHLVWAESYVYYQRSNDSGISWSSPVTLSDTSCGGIYPKLRIYGNDIYCVWVEHWFQPYDYRVSYRHSANNGEIWDSVVHIGPSYQQSSFVAKGETLLVVVCIRDSVPPDPPGIYYYRSFDNGISWEGPHFIRNDIWSMGDPDMVVYGDSVFNVLRDGDSESVLYMGTTDWGNTWFDTTRVSINAELPKFPKICKNTYFYLFITWLDNKYSPGWLDDVILRRSTDGGINWLPEQQITNHHLVGYHDDIRCADSDVYLVWPKEGSSQEALQFRASTDMGEIWWPIEDLCNNMVFTPTISADSTKLHVAWDDQRSSDPSEIFYRRGTRLPVGVAEKKQSVTSALLTNISVIPNPFREKTEIRFRIQDTGYRIFL